MWTRAMSMFLAASPFFRPHQPRPLSHVIKRQWHTFLYTILLNKEGRKNLSNTNEMSSLVTSNYLKSTLEKPNKQLYEHIYSIQIVTCTWQNTHARTHARTHTHTTTINVNRSTFTIQETNAEAYMFRIKKTTCLFTYLGYCMYTT